MLKVLKSVPGVTDARLGVVHSDGWTHSYLAYHANEGDKPGFPKNNGLFAMQFDAQKGEDGIGRYWFLAYVSGFGGAPDLHVTDIVMNEWKIQCDVDSNILFP
jgi:hypothetical protein